jgi:hypothetical protein
MDVEILQNSVTLLFMKVKIYVTFYYSKVFLSKIITSDDASKC